MNKLDLTLKFEVYNEKNEYFEFYSEKKEIEEIKKKCQEKYKYPNKDINNINFWCIDDDNDKNLINNDIDLMEYIKEITPSKFLIKLYVDINNKLKEDKDNEFNEKEDKDKDKQNKYYYEINLEKKIKK